MLQHRSIQREDFELARLTCNKCGRSWEASEAHPSFTTIKHTYGYGSKKDGDKYVSHICEDCMDGIYVDFKIQPEVSQMLIWGEEPPDPLNLIDAPITVAPVAPAVEEHASQEEET
jgi:hypothetical protein